MSLIAYLILLAFTGLLVGGLARLALPGRDPMTLWQTMAIGIAGSYVAGVIALALWHGRRGAGLLLSVLVATFFVWLVRRARASGRGPMRR